MGMMPFFVCIHLLVLNAEEIPLLQIPSDIKQDLFQHSHLLAQVLAMDLPLLRSWELDLEPTGTKRMLFSFQVPWCPFLALLPLSHRTCRHIRVLGALHADLSIFQQIFTASLGARQ